eukprot:jgi/Botrbrau1/20663/Bobra.0847s0001.2
MELAKGWHMVSSMEVLVSARASGLLILLFFISTACGEMHKTPGLRRGLNFQANSHRPVDPSHRPVDPSHRPVEPSHRPVDPSHRPVHKHAAAGMLNEVPSAKNQTNGVAVNNHQGTGECLDQYGYSCADISGNCPDFNSDDQYCGSCSNSCDAPTGCLNGVCVCPNLRGELDPSCPYSFISGCYFNDERALYLLSTRLGAL